MERRLAAIVAIDVIGIEACDTSYHWARKLEKVDHEVRLMPARYVEPYVKRSKNDATNAEVE